MSLYHQSKIPHQVTCRASPEGLPVIGSKTYLDMCEVALYGAGSCGVSLSTAHFSSAKSVRGHTTLATLEMKTHGENNKLICRMKRTFFLSAQSPRVTPVLWAEKEAPMKTRPSSSGERHANAYVVSVLRPSLTFNGLQIMTVVFGCFQMRFQQISTVWFICIHCFKSLFFFFCE